MVTQDVFRLALARPVMTAAGEHPHLVHLWWALAQDASPDAWRVQAYVDGELAAVSVHAAQREMWLALERSRPHRIELLAVPARDGDALWRSHPAALRSWDPRPSAEAEVALLRDARLPVETRVHVALDGRPVDAGPLWPADEPRGGFGALFGVGGFGSDDAVGYGLGLGELGYGPLGSDGTAWRWRRGGLPPGPHAIEVTTTDRHGDALSEPLTRHFDTQRLPPPPQGLALQPNHRVTWR